ncbi:hypothetical protein [Polaribacter sp.]|uniref:hypothetical protein n=1 Tax=Polaribacter sp. TaxID=1920175 RepID=UPI003EF4821F
MIKIVKRKDLNIDKYNTCIENAVQSRIFAFSWYLDIVTDHWDVLVLDNYKAVMPIPWRKKYGIKYGYPPLWLLELGLFSLDENQKIAPFLDVLFKKYRFIETRLNTSNCKENSDYFLSKQFQYLSLTVGYDAVFKSYNRNRKRELTKAVKSDLTENWNDKPEKLISLFKTNIASRVKNISEKDYINLLELMNCCLQKRVGELLTIYDVDNKLVAAAFFLKHKNEVTQLVCASDVKNRKNGAHTFFNDRAIYKYQSSFCIYNFGGSSMKSIANYYKSFGAKTKQYYQLKYNNLPFILQFFKK